MESIAKIIARSDARFDGDVFDCRGRADRQRYIDRAIAAVKAVKAATDDSIVKRALENEALRQKVEAFVEKQRIDCPETIYQTDRVIEHAYEFIHELVEISGYRKSEDEEASC